jgi:hypothetical protein
LCVCVSAPSAFCSFNAHMHRAHSAGVLMHAFLCVVAAVYMYMCADEVPAAVAVVPLNAAMLEQCKTLLAAGKITGKLMEMDDAELLMLLEKNSALSSMVDEAYGVLKLSNPGVNTTRGSSSG